MEATAEIKGVFKGSEDVLITRHGDNTAGIGSSGQLQGGDGGVSEHLWIHPRHHPPAKTMPAIARQLVARGYATAAAAVKVGHSTHRTAHAHSPAGPPPAQLPHRHLCHLHLPRRLEKVPQGPRGTRKGRRGL